MNTISADSNMVVISAQKPMLKALRSSTYLRLLLAGMHYLHNTSLPSAMLTMRFILMHYVTGFKL